MSKTPHWKEFKVVDGAQFTVKGTSLRVTPHRFSINLTTQIGIKPTASLHFEVRFDEKNVVLNSVENDNWGTEQWKDNPFALGGPFEVNVLCTAESFVIKFGGEEAEFKYRGKPSGWVKYIYIEGQATISAVDVNP